MFTSRKGQNKVVSCAKKPPHNVAQRIQGKEYLEEKTDVELQFHSTNQEEADVKRTMTTANRERGICHTQITWGNVISAFYDLFLALGLVHCCFRFHSRFASVLG